jgi:hypothetical protein
LGHVSSAPARVPLCLMCYLVCVNVQAMQKDAQNVVSPNQLAGHLNRAAREAAEEQEKERV